MKNFVLFISVLFLSTSISNKTTSDYNDFNVVLNHKKEEPKVQVPEIDSLHIVIGDSQSPYIANASEKAKLLSTTGGESSLWLGGRTVSWLIGALKKYKLNNEVSSILLSIGPNGGFGKFINDDVSTLISLVNEKFPNATVYAVQGSWGWGGLKNIKESEVRSYYQKYKDLGVIIVEPPIGNIEPHGNKPIYKVIGKNLDSLINL